MRRYDDPVDVHTGQVHGTSGVWEGPAQFLWRDRLWQVRDVVAHWLETGPWWQSAEVRAVIGSDEPAADDASRELVREREVWRVEAARPGARAGVFDLVRDWTTGAWRLTGVVD